MNLHLRLLFVQFAACCLLPAAFPGTFFSALCGTVAAAEPAQTEPVSFELDVMPILTARGCNAGACHGKQRGQNGFQLSLLGFDPEYDYAAVVKNARGRRVFQASPSNSLLLQKASGQLPHGGGVRLPAGGEDYKTLLRWIAAGAPRSIAGEPTLDRVELHPANVSLHTGSTQQLKMTAYYSDGTQRDVTGRSGYQSNASAVAKVDDAGAVTAGPIPGETAVMARYMNHIDVCHVVIPLAKLPPPEVYEKLPRNNFIDDLVWKKLAKLGLKPSEGITDAKFMRRVHLDLIGRLPTPGEARKFLANTDPDRRSKLVDALLQRREYADHWAHKWADLLRPNPYHVGIKATLNYDNWIRQAFRRNQPYDKFVSELVTARGSTFHNGAVTMFRDRRAPEEITTLVSQLFLGVRLECARCHHHPFEKWGQEDFYSFAAYFARIGRKGRGISAPISGSEEIIMTGTKGEVSHPLTGEVLPPKPLTGPPPVIKDGQDRRQALAQWMTAPENPFFATVQVNRVWADLMGRGIVDPVDDLRATNPPVNGPLLDALAAYLREQNYDLKKLLKLIATSHVYALSSIPNETNSADTLNYSRHYRSRLRGETLYDAVADITGQQHKFAAMPPGSLATQIWTHRVGSVFLDTFGRPNPNQDPPCERLGGSTVTQTLHLMNSPQLYQRVISSKGRAAQLAASKQTDKQIVEELYLLIYSRLPDEEEQAIAAKFFARSNGDRKSAAQQLMWALLNTPEFIIGD